MKVLLMFAFVVCIILSGCSKDDDILILTENNAYTHDAESNAMPDNYKDVPDNVGKSYSVNNNTNQSSFENPFSNEWPEEILGPRQSGQRAILYPANTATSDIIEQIITEAGLTIITDANNISGSYGTIFLDDYDGEREGVDNIQNGIIIESDNNETSIFSICYAIITNNNDIFEAKFTVITPTYM